MRSSTSHHVTVRDLRIHVRTWGDPAHPPVLLLHGWMDVSASFQFTADAMVSDHYLVAPDWRGFGLSQWATDGYWFPDYLADLDALLDVFSPGAPAAVVGHSMGGNIAGLYAGIRPDRVSKLVLAEGFGLKETTPDDAPKRYGRWLGEQRSIDGFRPYADLDAVAAHLRKTDPGLTEDRARFLAPHWSMPGTDGRLVPAADPRHKWVNPVLYRLEEALACWRRITAPTLWIWGGDRDWMKRFTGEDAEEWARRRGAFARLAEVRIEDSGHMMHRDQPARFAAHLEAFLEADRDAADAVAAPNIA